MPGGHSDDGYTASNGVSWASRRERTQVPTVADALGSQDQGQEAICDLFQGQEEDSTVAAKDESRDKHNILRNYDFTTAELLGRSIQFPSKKGIHHLIEIF